MFYFTIYMIFLHVYSYIRHMLFCIHLTLLWCFGFIFLFEFFWGSFGLFCMLIFWLFSLCLKPWWLPEMPADDWHRCSSSARKPELGKYKRQLVTDEGEKPQPRSLRNAKLAEDQASEFEAIWVILPVLLSEDPRTSPPRDICTRASPKKLMVYWFTYLRLPCCSAQNIIWT